MKKLIVSGVVFAVLLIGGAYAAIMAVNASRLSKKEAPAVVNEIVKKSISDMKTGPAGKDGQDGMPCFAGLQEDKNGDGIINVEDCRGDKGDPGTSGTAATAVAGAKASAKTATSPASPAVATAPTPATAAPAAPAAPAKAKAKKAASGKAPVATGRAAANPPITFSQSVDVEVNGVSLGGEEEEETAESADDEDEARHPFVSNEGSMVYAPVNVRVGGGRKGRHQ